MTRMNRLADGTHCIQVETKDSDNDVRIHLHSGQTVDIKDVATLEGIRILSRSGVLYERGRVECG